MIFFRTNATDGCLCTLGEVLPCRQVVDQFLRTPSETDGSAHLYLPCVPVTLLYRPYAWRKARLNPLAVYHFVANSERRCSYSQCRQCACDENDSERYSCLERACRVVFYHLTSLVT